MSVYTPKHPVQAGRPAARLHPYRRRIALCASVIAAILLVGALGPWPFTHGTGQFDATIGPGDKFSPATLTIHAGDVVTWHFDGNDHTVTADGGPGPAWDSGVKATGTFSHAFDRAGTFGYICVLHPGKMKATVVVLPADAAAGQAATPPSGAGAAPAPPAVGDAAATTAASTGPAAATPGVSPSAAPPRLAALRVRVSHRRAVATLTTSQAGSLTVRAGQRRLVSAKVGAGRQRVRISLAGLRKGRARLSFVLTSPAGNRSAIAVRSVVVT